MQDPLKTAAEQLYLNKSVARRSTSDGKLVQGSIVQVHGRIELSCAREGLRELLFTARYEDGHQETLTLEEVSSAMQAHAAFLGQQLLQATVSRSPSRQTPPQPQCEQPHQFHPRQAHIDRRRQRKQLRPKHGHAAQQQAPSERAGVQATAAGSVNHAGAKRPRTGEQHEEGQGKGEEVGHDGNVHDENGAEMEERNEGELKAEGHVGNQEEMANEPPAKVPTGEGVQARGHSTAADAEPGAMQQGMGMQQRSEAEQIGSDGGGKPKSRKRRYLFQRIDPSERCGTCRTCRNPKLKQACEMVRARQLEQQRQVQGLGHGTDAGAHAAAPEGPPVKKQKVRDSQVGRPQPNCAQAAGPARGSQGHGPSILPSRQTPPSAGLASVSAAAGASPHTPARLGMGANAGSAPPPRPSKPHAAPEDESGQVQAAGIVQGAFMHAAHDAALGGDGAPESAAHGSAGRLKRIHLINFMCHANLVVEFSKHVTILSGANGSGKSAVMQALQAALGVAARSTGRGASVAQFIRAGCDQATVTVEIHNDGVDGYQPEVYGPVVVLERRIRQGGSEYRLGAPGLPMRKARRDEVDAMLAHFNIDGSNPLTLITQDMLRSFFSGTNTKEDRQAKWDMFYKSTLLRPIQDCLAEAAQQLQASEEELKKAMVTVRQWEHELQEKTGILDALRAVEGAESEQDLLAQYLPWAVVDQTEQELKEVELKVEAADHAVQEAEVLLQQKHQEKERVQAKLEESGHQMQENQDIVIKTTERVKRLKEVKRGWTVARRAREEQLKQAEVALEDLKEHLKRIEADLQQAGIENQATGNDRADSLKEGMAAAKAAREAAQAALAAARAAAAEREAAADTARAAAGKARAAAADQQDQADSLGAELARAQRARTSPAQHWGGEPAARLKALVDRQWQQRKFSRKPVGPLGCHLRLVDGLWAKAVDAALGSSGYVWIVANSGDESRLRQLARTEAGFPSRQELSIFTTSFDVPQHTIPAREAPTPHPSGQPWIRLIDVLQIDTGGDVGAYNRVYNYLLDRVKAATTLLVQTDDEARNVGYNQVAGKHVLFAAASKSGLLVTRQGSTATSRPFSRRVPKLAVSVETQLLQLQEELDQAKARLSELEAQQAGMQAHKEAAATALMQAQDAVRRAQAQEAEAKMKEREVARELNSLAARDPEDLELMKLQVEQEIAAAQAAVTAAETELDEAVEEEETQERLVANEKKYVLNLKGQLEEMYNEMERLVSEEKRIRELAVPQQHDALTKAQGQLEAIKEDQREMQANVQRCKQEASQISDRATSRAAAAALRELVWEREVQAVRHEQGRGSSQRDNGQRPEAGGDGVAEAGTARSNDGAGLAGAQQGAGAQGQGADAEQELEAAVQARVAAAMCVENAHKRYDYLSEVIKSASKRAGRQMEDVQEQVEKLEQKVIKKNLQVRIAKNRWRKLTEALAMRQRAFGHLYGSVTGDINNKFLKHMARRKHLGHIKFDSKKCELSVRVTVNGKEQAGAKEVQDLKQLSGGERSYTVLSLLLAIGESSDSSLFHCMDEFDVFMDAVNRRVATETLLEYAWDSKQQYVFLTPQDIDTVVRAREQLLARPSRQDIGGAFPPGFLSIKRLAAPRDAGGGAPENAGAG